MKNKLFNTSAWRITRVYAMLLTGIAIIMSLAIISVVGIKQYQSQRQNAIATAKGLKHSYISSKDDWYWWQRGSSTNSDRTFIKIKVTKKGHPNRYFYSPNAKEFLKNNQKGHRSLSTHVHYSTKTGLFYHTTSSEKAYGKWPSEHYDVWIELNNVTAELWLLFRLIVLITLIFLVLGTWVIYLLARRLNKPLVYLTKTTKVINKDISNQYQTQLPVPNSPQEVHDLSVEFNHLLHSLNKQAQSDRQFVSNASHELKTPIAAIRGHVSLIKRRGDEHPEIIPTSLTFIDEETARMQRLIESLRQLSHANKLELTMTTVDLSKLVEQSVINTTNNHQIVTDIQSGIVTQTNSDSIQQILASLLHNAQKYSSKDQPVLVDLTADKTSVSLTVSDLGQGIPDDEKPHVFERFYRSKAVRNKVEGNGLGLAIVQQLVKLNHGQIEVTDNQPQGTKFIVLLPR